MVADLKDSNLFHPSANRSFLGLFEAWRAETNPFLPLEVAPDLERETTDLVAESSHRSDSLQSLLRSLACRRCRLWELLDLLLVLRAMVFEFSGDAGCRVLTSPRTIPIRATSRRLLRASDADSPR